ncbi:hypothetical protein PoB_006090000 [Plakobranchus ocellatus]|uniref:Uncharacterized protein n=1 Tax=Plakobranchus ocellatus TaxID=259542 RepID=A0AAV4CR46_9GAST|nr:hypothetical protein PoB_006090000 [Plakobranchus ocellatus]
MVIITFLVSFLIKLAPASDGSNELTDRVSARGTIELPSLRRRGMSPGRDAQISGPWECPGFVVLGMPESGCRVVRADPATLWGGNRHAIIMEFSDMFAVQKMFGLALPGSLVQLAPRNAPCDTLICSYTPCLHYCSVLSDPAIHIAADSD